MLLPQKGDTFDNSTHMDFCFVHAADLHLDTAFQGIGKLAPRVVSRAEKN